MTVEIKKIPGGIEVDGLRLRKGKCGCDGGGLSCCFSWSKVKRKGDEVNFKAKMSGPDSGETFDWGYTVSKEGVTVNVSVEDAAEKEIYSGYFPPAIEEWESRGWEIVSREGERRDGTVWRCAPCKWLYKEDEEGRPFEELPDDWKCPNCGVGKDQFEKIT